MVDYQEALELTGVRTPLPEMPPNPRKNLHPPSKVPRLVWTKEMDQFYIESLFTAHRDGKRVEPGGFKDEAWVNCVAAVQRFCSEQSRISKAQVKNRLVWWRNHYKDWKTVKETSGMGWDYAAKLFDADDSVWSSLLSAHPRLRSFRYHITLYVEEMEVLFDGRMATGESAFGISQLTSQGLTAQDDESSIDPALEGPSYSISYIRTSSPCSDHEDIEPSSQSVSQFETQSSHRKRAASRSDPTASHPHQSKRERSGGMAKELVKAISGMNKESELIREMMQQSFQREVTSQESWQKQALRQIRVQYPLVAKLLTAQKTATLLRYLAEEEEEDMMCRGEFFLFLEDEERLPVLKTIMELAGIVVKSKRDGTIYGELITIIEDDF